MRLSQIVTERGLDAFNAEDFRFVGSKLSADPDRLVLVGGQAIETWGLYFGVARPTGDVAPLTEDTDFYGGKKDAIWLCNLLGKKNTELILNKDFDPSPNTAIAYIERPDGRVLLVDFLRTVIGLSPKEITTLAVPVNVDGVRLSVLHPLLCLESRLANLDKLSSKRNSNGVLQAEWAINIAEAYLLRMRAEGASDRDMIKACHTIAESAEYRSGPYCFHNHGVDPLRAVSDAVLEEVGGRFVADDWPRRIERIRSKREKKLISYRVDVTAGTAPRPIPVLPVDPSKLGA